MNASTASASVLKVRQLLRLAVLTALIGASALYVYVALSGASVSLRDIRWLARPGLLVAALVLHAVALTAGCRMWWMVLIRLAPHCITPLAHWRIWALTNLARYIPGRVWHVAALGVMMESAGVAPAVLVTSLLLHMWFYLLAACLVALALIPADGLAVVTQWASIVLGIVVVVCAVHPRILAAGVALVARITRRPVVQWQGSWAVALFFVGMGVLIHVLNGISVVLLLAATGLRGTTLVSTIGANAAAFLAGYLSFVPAGLGVREAAMTAVLKRAALPDAPVIAVVVRVAATVTEVLLALVALAIYRFRSRIAGPATERQPL